jgi:hypothetical protein
MNDISTTELYSVIGCSVKEVFALRRGEESRMPSVLARRT